MHTYNQFQDHKGPNLIPRRWTNWPYIHPSIIQVKDSEPFKGEIFRNLLFRLATSKYKQYKLLYILMI